MPTDPPLTIWEPSPPMGTREAANWAGTSDPQAANWAGFANRASAGPQCRQLGMCYRPAADVLASESQLGAGRQLGGPLS